MVRGQWLRIAQTPLMPPKAHGRQPLVLDDWQGRCRVKIKQSQGNPSLEGTRPYLLLARPNVRHS